MVHREKAAEIQRGNDYVKAREAARKNSVRERVVAPGGAVLLEASSPLLQLPEVDLARLSLPPMARFRSRRFQ
ncbi:hypothetical protein ACQEU1_06595 [Lentzea sp. CA-135723]